MKQEQRDNTSKISEFNKREEKTVKLKELQKEIEIKEKVEEEVAPLVGMLRIWASNGLCLSMISKGMWTTLTILASKDASILD